MATEIKEHSGVGGSVRNSQQVSEIGMIMCTHMHTHSPPLTVEENEMQAQKATCLKSQPVNA